ncbi:MAG: alpha/beta fold hydrolase [Candidatus Heimdallarchaeota archaeon]|nr:MAG: alpha/beta fold hydrolase [Candidatus Heimdallarchaeota archaeon]
MDFDELESLKHLAKSFYFEGGELGVLLVHGFTASPTETLPLGKYLNKKGYTVYGVLLAGHGTNYQDLPNFSWQDWYKSVENGFDYLKDHCKTIIPIGISLGALLCLYLTHNSSNTIIPKLCLLAPPFALKSKLIRLIPILGVFRKFLYKGEESLQYFKEHNLYSYMYRPTASVVQLTRFLKHLREQKICINIPTLIAYGSLDNMISIPAIMKVKTQMFASEAKIRMLELPKSGHILTVEPDSKELFHRIEKFLE